MEQSDEQVEQRLQKQIFLKQNIVEKGYDKQEFAEFMNQIKDSNSNIDMWSLEEIKQIVLNFQNQCEPVLNPDNLSSEESVDLEPQIKENNDIHNVEKDKNFDFEQILRSPCEKENIKKEQSEKVTDKEVQGPKPVKILDFEDGIRISDKTCLNKMKDVAIEITEAVQNPGSLFSFSFVEYTIDTHPFGWSVTRKEQDFKRFRDYIIKKFPQFVIPPLMQTKLLEAQADIETKKLYFQEFLRAIISNPELWACKFLEEFLSINDDDGYKQVRKLREKEPAPTNLSTYSNLSGRAKLTIQCQNVKILDDFNGFFIDKYEGIMKNIKESLGSIKTKSKELADSISSFGNNIESLSELFSDWGFDDTIQLYDDIRCITTAYEESVIKQADVVEKKLNLDINFHLLEANSFKEFHKHREDVYWDFYKLGKDLQNKKDKLWEDREKKETHVKWHLHQEDISSFDKLVQNEYESKAKMLPKESQIAWDKNNQYKHLQRQSVEEIRRWSQVLSDKFRQNFTEIAQEQLIVINR